MKKFLLLISVLLMPVAFGAIGSSFDRATVGTYLYPKTDGLPLGASDKKWASWLSSINGADIDDAILPTGGSAIDYLTGDRTWVNLTTSAVTEGTRLYYTDARVRAAVSGTAPITFDSGTGAIGCTAASTSVAGCLSSANWNTFNDKEPAISAGSSDQYYRGDKSFQTLNTAVVPESGNLYYTDVRARASQSATLPLSYDNSTGVHTIADGASDASGVLTTSAQGIGGEKTFENALGLKQISTPANPSATYNKLYFKSDNKLYKLTSGGTETEVGSGGVGGAGTVFVGSITYGPAASCSWDVTANQTFTSFPADTDCPTPTIRGNGVSAPGTKIPGVVVTSMDDSGDYIYEIKATGWFRNGSTGGYASWRVTNGTDSSSPITSNAPGVANAGVVQFIYGDIIPTISGSQTFQLQCTGTDTNGNCYIDASIGQTGFTLSVYKTPVE